MVSKRPLISADNHVFEPVTLWQERLPLEYRDRGPRLERRDDWLVMAIEGMPDRKLTRTTTDSDGTPSLGSHAGGFDLDGRLHDMALDGVVAEVIYPTFGLFIDMVPAPDLQMACAQVYNDWLAESFLARPDVFIPAAVVPVRDVASATAELERVAQLGFKAAMIPTSRAGRAAVQPARLRPALEDRIRREHAALVAHGHRRAAAAGARARWRSHQLREGRPPVGRDALLLRGVGSARAVPPVAPGVRRDGRRLVRVLLRAHGRGLRGARAVGESQARARRRRRR